MNCGIYQIHNKVTDKCYIGSSVDLDRRLSRHRCSLRDNKHQNKKLQNSWNKYGKESFTIKPILYCSAYDLLFYEQSCIDLYLSHKGVYNIRLVAETNLGLSHTEDAKRRISETLTGFKRPPRTQEHKDNLSKALVGRKPREVYFVSEEVRRKISLSLTGRKQSEETKMKKSKSLLGNTNATGSKHSAEANRKKSILQKGKVTSEETKKKMSIAAKNRHKALKDKKLKEATVAE